MNLKKTLKTIKLHQEQISMFFGVLILIVAGLFVINYIKNLKSQELTKESASTENKVQIHTVTKGESLWSISKIYYKEGSNWKKIADANNITVPSKLEVGTKLTIPENENTTPSPSPVPQITPEAASTTSPIAGENYTVVRGDSLWKIAVRAYGDGYKWVKISKENKLKNPNLIHPGNVLTIPR